MILSYSEVNREEVRSDILKQLLIFKDLNPDAIIFIQIGTFFETYFEDAKKLSEASGIMLSSRSFSGIGKVIQAGVPKESLNFYIKALLNNDYKVCVCPQFSDENGRWYRKITRTYTKGTIIENEFLDCYENNYILSLYKDDAIINIAYSDVSTGQFYKTFADDYKAINLEVDKICPSEILISEAQKEYFVDISLKYNTSFVKEDFFKDKKAENAIIEYCKFNQKEYIPKFDKITEYKIKQFLLMDEVTRLNLELTRTKRLLKKKGSLFWFLNYTQTSMGSRLLKKYINEPLLVVEKIKERENAVDELIKAEDKLKKVEEILSGFCDLARICAGISNSTINPKSIYAIVDNSKSLELLKEATMDFSSGLLKINNKNFEKLIKLSAEINSAIKVDASSDVKSGDIINDGYDSNLDYLREKLSNCNKKIENYEAKEKKRLKINKLKIVTHKAYLYFEIPNSMTALVPDEYLKNHSNQTNTRYTTDKLKEIEAEKFDLKYKISQLEYEIYCKIRNYACAFVEAIRAIAKDIARMDVIASLARCAIINNLSCPKFNNEGLFIKNGFHPSLLKLNNDLVKNDTEIKKGQMYVVTGANMSGKSTYLKHNAIICLLAQIGSFVPADLADVDITDKIFLRQGAVDDIINNNSSFMVEMNDLKYILDNATEKSLVLLDEPAKSTNATEGGAIARAFCEYLCENIKAKSIVVTHNLELTKMEAKYPNKVINWLIGSGYNNLDRKLKRGVMKSSLATDTAELAELPEEIIKNASKYMH